MHSQFDNAACGYPIFTEEGGPAELAETLNRLRPAGRLLVVTDSNVARLHCHALVDAVEELGREVRLFVVPAGEGSKSPDTLIALWNQAFSGAVDRDDCVVAVGGGVPGDIGGFFASTLMRGLPVIQVPTTVLAMSDAAIGGKTGVNLAAGKNLVGSFHRPLGVVQWTGALQTLDAREHRSGLAEVVKSAWIDGPEFLDALEVRCGALASRDAEATRWAVGRAAALKARIVAADELEGGVRRLLNLGHTFGHALERSSGYGTWTHGECVSVGMVMAFRYGETVGFTGSGETQRLISILESLKLPAAIPSLKVTEWLDPILRDKKRTGDAIRLILCSDPGACEAVATPIAELVDWVKTL